MQKQGEKRTVLGAEWTSLLFSLVKATEQEQTEEVHPR